MHQWTTKKDQFQFQYYLKLTLDYHKLTFKVEHYLLIKVSAGEEAMPACTRAEGCEGVLLRGMASAPPMSSPRVVKVGSSTGGEHGLLDEDIAVLRVGSEAAEPDKTLFSERLIS